MKERGDVNCCGPVAVPLPRLVPGDGLPVPSPPTLKPRSLLARTASMPMTPPLRCDSGVAAARAGGDSGFDATLPLGTAAVASTATRALSPPRAVSVALEAGDDDDGTSPQLPSCTSSCDASADAEGAPPPTSTVGGGVTRRTDGTGGGQASGTGGGQASAFATAPALAATAGRWRAFTAAEAGRRACVSRASHKHQRYCA